MTIKAKAHTGTHATTATLKGSFMNVAVAWLRPWQEVVGTVDDIETYEERVVINILTSRRISLEIPFNELMEDGVNLVQLTGQQVSILRTDTGYLLQCKPDN